MLITIKEITKEDVVKGRTRYGKAAVVYDYQGQTRTQNVLSFSNPEVYQKLDSLKPGDKAEVTITKNDAGYNQWAKLEDAGSRAPAAASTAAPAKAGGTWETAEERARKQVYIIKQSCLAQAVATLAIGSKSKPEFSEVLSLAETYLDWVMDDDLEEGFGTNETVSQE